MYKFHTDNQFPKLLVLYVATSAKDLKKARTLAKYSINVGGILSSSSVPTCVSGLKKNVYFSTSAAICEVRDCECDRNAFDTD